MRRFLRIAIAAAVLIAVLAACDSPTLPDATDCSADVTSQLSSYLGAQSDGSTVELPAEACYRTDGTVMVQGKHDLTIHGNGTTFKRVTHSDAREAKHVRIDQSSNIAIDHLTVDGEKPNEIGWTEDIEGQAAVMITASHGVTLDNVTLSHVYGDGLQVNTASSNVTLSNSTIDNVGRQGIALNDVDVFTIVGNVIKHARRFAIDYEPMRSTDHVRNGSVAFNQLLCPTWGFETGASRQNVENVTRIYNVSSWDCVD